MRGKEWNGATCSVVQIVDTDSACPSIGTMDNRHTHATNCRGVILGSGPFREV